MRATMKVNADASANPYPVYCNGCVLKNRVRSVLEVKKQRAISKALFLFSKYNSTKIYIKELMLKRAPIVVTLKISLMA